MPTFDEHADTWKKHQDAGEPPYIIKQQAGPEGMTYRIIGPEGQAVSFKDAKGAIVMETKSDPEVLAACNALNTEAGHGA